MAKAAATTKSPAVSRGAFVSEYRERGCSVLGRPGSDLLFQTLRFSTIGAEDFDGRVRDGIGYRLLAMTTKSAKDGTIRDQEISSQASGRQPTTIRTLR
jgi:hypothetical protein